MKYKFLRISFLSAIAFLFGGGIALGAFRAAEEADEPAEMEAYDFQDLCMDLYAKNMFTKNPDPVRDGGDAGFTIGDAVMHYLGDYDELGYTWNQRFAYEYNDKGKFTFRNRNNKKDGNCGMFSWDYAHKFSILGLKDGDNVIITIGTGTVTFVSDNAEGVEAGAAVVSNQAYTITTEEKTTHLDIEMATASLIAKIQIIPAGAEIVPTIKLDKDALTLNPEETATVKATVEPSMPVQWKSSNESVATVENGVVTAVAIGEAEITCYWKSEVSDKVVEASLTVTVTKPFVIDGELNTKYDFTAMGDVTLVKGEKAGSIYNAANSKNNDVFYCTNKGLENIAIQDALANNRGWSIVDGKGLYEGSGAGRCAAVAGIKKGQIVEFFYTGATFDTKSDGSDDGIAKTELLKKDGYIVFKADANGMIGFELTRGNYVEQINIYDTDDVEEDSGDASIEGEWEFTLPGYWPDGKLTYTATLDGNVVTFTDEWEDVPLKASFTSPTTIEFSKRVVKETGAKNNVMQIPYVKTGAETEGEWDTYTEQTFTAEYDAEAGTITFPGNSGIMFAYVNAETGDFDSWYDGFDTEKAVRLSGGTEEETYEVVGQYSLTILPTDLAGVKDGEPFDIQVEVRQSGDKYWIAEVEGNVMEGLTVPFTYNEDTQMATFDQTYVGKVGSENYDVWFAVFVANDTFIEPQPTFVAAFDTENGFTWENGKAGFAWYISSSSDEFDPSEVYTAFYVSASDDNEEEGGEGGTDGLSKITTVKAVDVYSLDGKLIRKQATTLDGLKGLYIVNGKKVVLK